MLYIIIIANLLILLLLLSCLMATFLVKYCSSLMLQAFIYLFITTLFIF